MRHVRLLVAPDAFKGTFRAPEVAAAVGRGIEAAGLEPPDLCPIADGGEGTMEALVLALGGETRGATARDPLGREIRAGFALLEDGATAVVEVAEASGLGLVVAHERDAEATTSHGTGDLIAAAIDAGASGVLVLDAVSYDERARAAFAVVVGEGRLDETTLHGKAVFEAATRARQMGVPAHAIVGQDRLDAFGKRMLDLQHVLEASGEAQLEAAGSEVAARLLSETAPG